MKTTVRLIWRFFTDFLNTFMIIITTIGMIPVFIQMWYFIFADSLEKAVAMGIIFYILVIINLKIGGNVVG